VIVVGAGHAGIEAALASARSGAETLMLTLNADSVGQMSCNPAIGGIGKGHLVREIDALGGEMGRAIDECGIQFRRLNTRKGPAVQASRAQADKARYRARMKRVVESTQSLTLRQAEVVALLDCDSRVCGIVTDEGEKIGAPVVVLTTGTFMEGLMHSGGYRRPGGRAGDRASRGLSADLVRLGLTVGRLKTGTCPRLDRRTIDTSALERQPGDDPPPRFGFGSRAPLLPQVVCHITYSNPMTHRIIRDNIELSAMYSGAIRSRGPRYCPSIEDKVMKFPDRDRHRIFLEPEGLDTVEVYPNGLSTALPLAVQKEFVATIQGLEHAVIVRPGYAIEYDYVLPTQLRPSLACKDIAGLFLAGQINGTTGYEEAAAQGFVAGVNAVRCLRGEQPFVPARSEAYIGVLLDDLVTGGVDGEPYRMFTSRAEFRLLLREDNADLRLYDAALRLGLIGEERRRVLESKRRRLEKSLRELKAAVTSPSSSTNRRLHELGESPLRGPTTAYELLRRPSVPVSLAAELAGLGQIDDDVSEQLKIEACYEGYVQRQRDEIERMNRMETTLLPERIDYSRVRGLSSEAEEKLSLVRPRSLGQAARVRGVTPAAVSALAIYLKTLRRA